MMVEIIGYEEDRNLDNTHVINSMRKETNKWLKSNQHLNIKYIKTGELRDKPVLFIFYEYKWWYKIKLLFVSKKAS